MPKAKGTMKASADGSKRRKVDKPPAGKAHKIRLYPTAVQKQLLRKWMGTARWTYNQCVEAVSSGGVSAKKDKLRAHYINESAFKTRPELQDKQWVKETPYDVRDEAMNDLLKALKAQQAKIKANGWKGTAKANFKMSFRSRKAEAQSIAILAKHYNRKRGKYAWIKHIKAHQPLPAEINYDSRLLRTRLGHYYLCLPLPLDAQESKGAGGRASDPLAGVLALDPGVRTFMTGYDPTGQVVEWGAKDLNRIYRLCRALDDLQRRWSLRGVRHRKRYRLKRAARRLRLRIRNLFDELHKRMAKWLCENYRVVLLPKFQTSQMVAKPKRGALGNAAKETSKPTRWRKINSKTARGMLCWAHFRFRQRLLAKQREYPDCTVVVCDEAYTSKTCGSCGHIHANLGGAKRFRCPHCTFELDRDVNGARNILLRYLTLQCQSPAVAAALAA